MTPQRRNLTGPALALLLMAMTGGCGGSGADGGVPSSHVEVDLEKSDPERLLRYYFGGYAAPGGGDPFAAGLVTSEKGRYYVDTEVLDALHPGDGAALASAARNGRLAWKGLSAFLNASYYDARGLPPTLDALRAEVPYLEGSPPWFHVEIDGVMTTARRHVYVAEAALREALVNYRRNGERLLYPEGTALVGEHVLEGRRIETTVMRKRSDGFWDFFTYGPDGRLAAATQALPRALKTPTQCVGCHFGGKLFEPERSFPAAAQPGPHGPRALYVADVLRDREVVTFFDEHRKRSDTVLGIYNTLFVARLRAEQRAGRLSTEDVQLLDGLGFY